MSINRERKLKKRKNDEILIEKIKETLLAFGQYERWMENKLKNDTQKTNSSVRGFSRPTITRKKSNGQNKRNK